MAAAALLCRSAAVKRILTDYTKKYSTYQLASNHALATCPAERAVVSRHEPKRALGYPLAPSIQQVLRQVEDAVEPSHGDDALDILMRELEQQTTGSPRRSLADSAFVEQLVQELTMEQPSWHGLTDSDSEQAFDNPSHQSIGVDTIKSDVAISDELQVSVPSSHKYIGHNYIGRAAIEP